MKKLTKEQFEQKVILTHGDVFNFTKTEYVNNKTKVIVTCKKHGDFSCKPDNLLIGKGCPECKKDKISNRLRKTFPEFVKVANEKHSSRYTYDPVSFDSSRTDEKIKISCPQHGDFWQTRASHLQGCGCPLCARPKVRRLSTFDVTQKVTLRGFTLEYYDNSSVSNKSMFRCENGHTWEASYNNVVNNNSGCPKCANWGPSSAENEIFSLVKNLCGDAVQSDRTVLCPKELDIYIPSKKVAIEFNGVYWHSTKIVGRGYHREKRKNCDALGIRLISVSEQDWVDRRGQVESIIISALGGHFGKRINARQCEIIEVDNRTYRDFMVSHHIQGYAHAPYKFGLVHPVHGLVSVMSFRQIKHGANNGWWDMVRYATSCNVRGGQSKLFSHASESLKMTQCQSFVDCDYFTGNSYVNSGFVLDSDKTVSYKIWHRKLGWMSRQAWWKANIPQTLRKLGLPEGIFDENKTQNEMIDDAGALIIENSGTKRYVWKKPA